MSCHEYQDALLDVARGVGADAVTAAHLRAHLERCPACAATLRTEQQLTADLLALAQAVGRLQAPDAVEGRLVEAFDEMNATRQTAVTGHRWRAAWRAAAIVALLAGAAWAWRTVTRPSAAAETRQAGAPRGNPAPGADAVASPVAEPVTTTSTPALRSGGTASRPAHSGRARRSPRVIAPVGFVSLPGTRELPAFESGEIVRVQLALETLPTYGVPIVPDAARNPVDAELLVAQDGRPRAIRLVRPTIPTRPATETRSVQ